MSQWVLAKDYLHIGQLLRRYNVYKLFVDPMSQQHRYVIKIAEGLFIPIDTGNRDYQEYLEWLAEGNEPLPADTEN